MTSLTRRQQAVLEYLLEAAERGYAPTLPEVCRGLGLSSRGSLHKHIRALAAAGLVEPPGEGKRGVHLTGAAMEGTGTLPLLGRIAAGRPLEAIAHGERIAVPEWLRGSGECYVLEVNGESMRDDGILDGDRVVIESRGHARRGEVVVALIDGEEATLKRYEPRPGVVLLHPANAAYEAIAVAPERLQIQGVVIAQMRRYG